MEELSLDYSEIQKTVEELLPDNLPITFRELVEQLVTGNTDGVAEFLKTFGSWLLSGITYPLESGLHLFAILMIAALITNVSRAFSKSNVSHVGYLCIYLLLAVYAAAGFKTSFAIVEEGVLSLCRFVEILISTYCVSIAFVAGSLTAAGYYRGTVFFIGALEFAVRTVLLPMTQAYLLIAFASCMQKKPVFTKLLELIETIFSWIQKTMLGIVLATGAVQGMLLPAIDKVKRNALVKTAGAIPGVGDLLSGAWETVLGAGAVLKNAVGIAGVILIFLLCSLPLCKVGLQCLMYRLLAAIAEPVTEETLEKFLAHVGVAHKLLFQVLFFALLLFLLLLVVMTRISG
ncbi:MAG: stage III sporulation protein AE [Lachnospiraceae bacterium]